MDNKKSIRALIEEIKNETEQDKELPESMILYHGSNEIVNSPMVDYGRTDVDFGKGFYMTADCDMASKWACRKATSVVNEYIINFKDLKVYRFKADKEWLDFVELNRNMDPFPDKYKSYDVLIGPTADDKLFGTLELYEDGLISAATAVEVINCMNYSIQYVIKTEFGLDRLKFNKSMLLLDEQKAQYVNLYRQDRTLADKRTKQILQEINRERG